MIEESLSLIWPTRMSLTRHMDNTPDVVSKLLGNAKKRGIGVIGMKIFGEGRHVADSEREQSVKYALTTGNTHCMTLGMESIAHIDDAVERVMRLVWI